MTGSCNSIFKDEHPNPGRLLQPRSQSELRTSRRSAHFGAQEARAVSAFSSAPHLALLTSDVPLPLPRQRVNDAGFNASSGHLRSLTAVASPSLTFASAGLARSPPPSAATDDARERTRQHSPNFLQSIRGSSTLANDRYPAPRRFSRRGVAPCGAPAMRNRTDRSGPESAPCKARTPALVPE